MKTKKIYQIAIDFFFFIFISVVVFVTVFYNSKNTTINSQKKAKEEVYAIKSLMVSASATEKTISE